MNSLSEIKNKVTRNKDGKIVFENFGYLSLLQVAGYVFPLITMPYLARVIGADGFGKIAFASAIVVWIQTISDWGFNLTATRDVAQNRADKDKVSHIFSNVLWARCLLTLLSGLILMIATVMIPYLRTNRAIIMITFLLVPGHILFPEWFFQAIEKMKFTTLFNLLIKFIFTIAVFLFIHDKNDYLLQPLLTTTGYFICGIGALFLILKRWGYTLYKPQKGEILKTIKGSTDVFLNSLMPNLYNSFSVMLLGFWGGSTANGLYDGGSKFPTIFYNFQSVLSRVLYPFLSRHPDKHSVYAKINIGSTIIGSLLLILTAPMAIRIMLGPEFEQSVIVMRILSFSVIFLSLNYTYGTNYLIIHHKEKPLRNLTFISSIIGICASIPLVYYFSFVGAAITVLLCRGLLGVGSYLLAKKLCNTTKTTDF